MRLNKFFLIAPTTLLLIVLQSFQLNFPVPKAASGVVAQTSDARKAEADRLNEQGIQRHQTSKFQAALQSWQQALAIYQEIGDHLGEGKALGNLGIAYRTLGDYAKAIDYHQQSLTIAKDIRDRLGEGKALGNLGIAYRALGNYAKAIDYQQQSLAIANTLGDRSGEGKALGNLGNAYYALGDYAKAIEYYQQDLAIAKGIGDHSGEGAALGNLGNAYHALGDYAKAIEYYQQHLAIAKGIGDRLGEGLALGNLGGAYYALGDYAKAIEYHQQRLAIANTLGDRSGEGAALGNLGISYHALGDYAKAIEYCQQHLAIAKGIGDRSGEGAALGNLGISYHALGDYAKAIEYYQQQLAITKGIGDRHGEGAALGNLGISYHALGDYAKAIEYYQQQLAITKGIGDRHGEGAALGNLGLAYHALGDYAKAIEYYQQQLAITKGIGNRHGEGAALGNLGLAYNALGDYAKAIEYCQQSLAIARLIGDLDGESKSLNNLGFALFRSGNLSESERILGAAIEKSEQIREKLGLNDPWKVSIFEQQAHTYLLLQKVLIAQNKTDKALETSERGRTRAFVELLARRLSPQLDAEPTVKHPNSDDIKKIAQQQNATIVEYSIFPSSDSDVSELYIWVISPNGKVTFRQRDLKSLNTSLKDLVTTTRESIGVRSIFDISVTNSPVAPERQTKKLQELHQLLIQPIADLLPTDPNARLIFIPHQDLFLVPFPALIDSDNKYLIEKHTILTAPSIQVLELTHQLRQNVPGLARGVLVVGNPNPMPFGLSPLLGSEKEAASVAKLLNAKALVGSQATEPAIMQQLHNARIIHLATHGTFNEQQPLESAIALAPSGNKSQSDGLLTAGEIFDLDHKLTAELLVLSACDTGRGRITGDGVIGLSRSWISAGIPSVIVSLWQVPDAPTAELMKEFYTNMYQKKLNKATALRQAMLKTMEKHRDNPRAWAAFTLIGEAE